jgi:hypothetical protein
VRKRLIRTALGLRLRELCAARLQALVPERFGSMSPFVAQAQQLIAGTNSNGHLVGALPGWARPRAWMETETDCLVSLRALCMGQHLDARPVADSSVIEARAFVALLEERRGGPPLERFQLLTERYSYPLNITLEGEEDVREYLLMRLMVQDRARLLKRTVNEMDTDELLLKLSLVALHAALAADLRYLDALNYYYELLPTEWEPAGEHPWLLVSYLMLYAHALAAQIREERECV